MKYRKQLADGDYSFGNNIQDFLEGQEAIGQAIKTKILLFYGEWWEDISQGIPMFQSVVGQTNKSNVTNALELLLNERVQEVPGVEVVNEITATISGRTISIYIRCTTENNEQVEVEVSI